MKTTLNETTRNFLVHDGQTKNEKTKFQSKTNKKRNSFPNQCQELTESLFHNTSYIS